MTNFSTNCLTRTTIQPNSTILAGIEACQAAANTPYCFPPNGTRICAPAEDIPFFWPQTYYPSDAKVALSYDPSSKLVLLINNTGNATQDYTPYMFDSVALSVPGVHTEKTMKMSILERRFDDDVEPFNLEVHEGPTLILVKTAEWPSRTSASSRPTATSGYDDNDDDDKKLRGIKGGAIAGIVLGVLVVIGLIFFCCCRKGGCCCGAKRTREARLDKREQAAIVEQGCELMEQKSTGGAARGVAPEERTGGDEVGRVEEARTAQGRRGSESMGDEPPPRYTP